MEQFPIFTQNDVYLYIKKKRTHTVCINKAILIHFNIKPKNKENFAIFYKKNILFTKELISQITFEANKQMVIRIIKNFTLDKIKNLDTFLTIQQWLNHIPEFQKDILMKIYNEGYNYLELERKMNKPRQSLKKIVDETITYLTYRFIKEGEEPCT